MKIARFEPTYLQSPEKFDRIITHGLYLNFPKIKPLQPLTIQQPLNTNNSRSITLLDSPLISKQEKKILNPHYNTKKESNI